VAWNWKKDGIATISYRSIKRAGATYSKCKLFAQRVTLKREGKLMSRQIANLDKARVGVKECIDTTMERIRNGENYTANVLPTRYGKSDVIRVCAIEAYEENIVSASLVLSPNKILRDQIIDVKKFQTMVNRYSINLKNIKTFTLKHIGDYQQICVNKEMLISTTMQLVAMNPDLFKLWVEHMIYKTGKPPLIFIDEAHTGSEDNTWGTAVEKLVDGGAKAILLTATPMRSDGKKIPGFKFELMDEAEAHQVTKEDVPDQPEKEKVNIWSGVRQKFRLISDHETTFNQAWAEETICKLSRDPFEVDMSTIPKSGIKEYTKLSDLSESATRSVLGVVVKDSLVVREGARKLVSKLKMWPNTAAIVFCGNDDDPIRATNAHAKHIRKCIEHYNPQLNVIIATSSDGSDGAELIDKFSHGSGDVLIVKQMASVGLDIPRMKVCLDLSPVRTPAAFIQRIMRVGTLYKPYTHAVYISPNDCVSIALFDALITGEGGEVGVSELELVRSYIKDREDKENDAYSYTIEGVSTADFSDTFGNKTNKDLMPSVKFLISKLPVLNESMTHSQIAEALNGVEIICPVEPPILNTSTQCEDLRRDINARISTALGKYPKGDPVATKVYVERRKNMYNVAKVACGIGYTSLTDVNDIDKLIKLKTWLDGKLSNRSVEYEVKENANR
jgi:hypothetical protein